MGLNTLWPGFIRFHYQSAAGLHTATISVNPIPQIGGGWNLSPHGGGAGVTSWNAFVDAYTAVWQPLSSTGTTLQYAELWDVPNLGDDPMFLETYEIGVPGTITNPSGYVPTQQLVFTYRTSEGGIGRAYVMATIIAPNSNRLPPTYGSAAVRNFAEFFTDTQSAFVYARDNGRPIAGVRVLTKVNDALRRRRNRQGLG